MAAGALVVAGMRASKFWTPRPDIVAAVPEPEAVIFRRRASSPDQCGATECGAHPSCRLSRFALGNGTVGGHFCGPESVTFRPISRTGLKICHPLVGRPATSRGATGRNCWCRSAAFNVCAGGRLGALTHQAERCHRSPARRRRDETVGGNSRGPLSRGVQTLDALSHTALILSGWNLSPLVAVHSAHKSRSGPVWRDCVDTGYISGSVAQRSLSGRNWSPFR
ncbi:hypothetical protein OKW45_008074 [Paraburkholderia sp. WSM4175]